MTSPKKLPRATLLTAVALLVFSAALSVPASAEEEASVSDPEVAAPESFDPELANEAGPGERNYNSSNGIKTGAAALRMRIRCFGRFANIVGTRHNDRIYGTNGQDVIAGLGGDDLISAGDKNDFICSGPGEDQAYGLGGIDKINGQKQADQVFGGGKGDFLYGKQGDDQMTGEEGTDYLYGAAGKDTLDGGFSGTGGGEGGGGGTGGGGEVAPVGLAPAPLQDEGTGGTGLGEDSDDYLYGGPDGDTMSGGDANDNMYGQGGDDTLQGENASDRMIGGPGRDTFEGGDGNDTMTGKGGDDAFSGDAGLDTVFGDGGLDIVDGGTEKDTIYGGEEADMLWGGDNRDTLFGDGGSDCLLGEEGIDTLSGGDQNDVVNGEGDRTDLDAMPDPPITSSTDPFTCNVDIAVDEDGNPSGQTTTNLVNGGAGTSDLCWNPSETASPQSVNCEITPIALSVEVTGVEPGGSGIVQSDVADVFSNDFINCSSTGAPDTCSIILFGPVAVSLTASGTSNGIDHWVWGGAATPCAPDSTPCPLGVISVDTSVTATFSCTDDPATIGVDDCAS